MRYSRKQLLFDDTLHYNWKRKSRPAKILQQEPAALELDRKDGFGVLVFINQFAERFGYTRIEEFREIEYLLHYGIASKAKSIAEIEEALINRLKKQGMTGKPAASLL